MSIGEGLQYILDHYGDTPPGTPWGSGHPLQQRFVELKRELEAIEPVTNRPDLRVDFSGRGRQALLPWLAIMNARETNSTQRGVYCVYLFRGDLSGVYLTLAVGVTAAKNQFGKDKAGYHQYIESISQQVRPYAETLSEVGFRVDGDIDLPKLMNPALITNVLRSPIDFMSRTPFRATTSCYATWRAH